MQLQLGIVISKQIDELDMGVLDDGSAYFSGNSLAKVCGVVPSAIIYQANQWLEGKRDGKLAKMLLDAGINRESLFYPVKAPGTPNGLLHAYTDDVCTVFIEYYAFEAEKPNETAKQYFRRFARATLRAVIYGAIGYKPNPAPDIWKQFHDRMMLNTSPPGYFSVFREMADVVMAAIQAGLVIDSQTVPDISIGRLWSAHWEENDLESLYGSRSTFPHVYPDYFAQAKAGPCDALVYPLAALGPFKKWMQEDYLPKRFPGYLSTKVQKGLIAPKTRDLILKAVKPHMLTP